MRPTEDTATVNGSYFTAFPFKIIDVGVLAVVFLAPLFMGGRGPVGKFVLVAIVCLTAVAWSIAQCRRARGHWQRSGVEWLLLASIVLVTLQLIPLPQAILASVSPSISELLPLWTSTDGSAKTQLGEWSTISLTPDATRGALIVLIGYVVLFLLVVQRIQSINDVERILRWVAIGTVAMAALGLLQFLVGNGKFLWIFDHPSRDTYGAVKGAFHNQNHFAHFLALGIGPLIWAWTKAPAQSVQKHLFGISLGLVFVAGLLTFSRGGVIAIAVASVAAVAIFYWKSVLDKKAMVMAGIMGAVVLVALLIHGYQPLSARFAALQNSRSLQEASHGRAALWSALLDGIPQFAVLGSGIGSHRDVYPIFMEEFYDVQFTHGENGYLPLTLEGGVPALLLMMAGIGICFWWCLRALMVPAVTNRENSTRGTPSSPRTGTKHNKQFSYAVCAGAIFPGLLASVVHSLGDFVWYISSCMSITIILLACACRLHQLSQDDGLRTQDREAALSPNLRYRIDFSQRAWIGVALTLVIGSGYMIHGLHDSALAAPHLYAYKKIALPTYKNELPEEAVELELLHKMCSHLEQGLQDKPDDPRLNLQFASACLRRFELEQRHATNPMALQQIREAALASQFASKEDQDDWLDRAIGENMKLLHLALTHCHRALRASPLQGEGYVYLANLSFLEGPNKKAKEAYIDQAFRVRPHNGVVAFAIGQERALVDDLNGAFNSWRDAFHQDPKIRSLIIEQFASGVDAAFFVRHFQPKTAALRQLQGSYQRHGRMADAQVVAGHLVDKLQAELRTVDGDAAAKWFELQGVYVFLQDSPAAVLSAQRAVELESGNVDYRRALGTLLLQNEDFSAAVEQLQWCLRRDPDNPALQKQLADANRGSLQRSASSPTIQPGRRQF
jgi:O-antigen ligase/tetratricopeptide (TPR) repeat protein